MKKSDFSREEAAVLTILKMSGGSLPGRTLVRSFSESMWDKDDKVGPKEQALVDAVDSLRFKGLIYAPGGWCTPGGMDESIELNR